MHPRALEELSDVSYKYRVVVLTAAGAVGAMLLTWFMFELIHSSQQRLDESARIHMLDFVRLKREEASEQKDRRPERPEVTEQPPAPATPQDSSDADFDTSIAVTALPAGMSGLEIGGLGFDSSDGEYLPIVKIAPVYPQRALARNIEGECVVIFTVTTTGTTRDIKVVESMCSDKIFYKPSVAAAAKFKYKPRVIDGEAVEVHDVANRFIYDLPDD